MPDPADPDPVADAGRHIVYVTTAERDATDDGLDRVAFTRASLDSPDWGAQEELTGLLGDVSVPGFAEFEADDDGGVYFSRLDTTIERLHELTTKRGQLRKDDGTVVFELSSIGLNTEEYQTAGLDKYSAIVCADSNERCLAVVFGTDGGDGAPAIIGADAIADAIAEQRRSRERTTAQNAAARARARSKDRDVFVNPYTFVPFPEREPDRFRHAPAGHARLQAGRWSGTIDVEFGALTPLLVRAGGSDDRWARDGSGRRIIPGSGWKGALRSLFETLAGGCLRVLDDDFVPVYRDPAQSRQGTWEMAVVDAVRNGRPTSFQRCDPGGVIWACDTHLPTCITTGERVDITGHQFDRQANKTVTTGAVAPSPEGAYVVLVQDDATRKKSNYHAACGKLNGHTIQLDDRPVKHRGDDEPFRPEHLSVWDRYLQEVAGADDVRAGRHGNQLVTRSAWHGHRRAVATTIDVGDVVWILVENGRITRISRAVLWRTLGSGAMRTRVPAWLRPCDGSSSTERGAELALCPACRVFGSADVGGADVDAAAEQRSYRGHVRLGDLHLDGTFEHHHLAPTGAPRAGAGQFYLAHDSDRPFVQAAKSRTPTRQWGADIDGEPPRPLRGRKLYWTADPKPQQPRRDRAHAGQAEGMENQATVLGEGATVSGRLVFENLTAAEVGAIVACLDPTRVLTPYRPPGHDDDAPLVFRIGGGKPFGYGALSANKLTLDAADAARRYIGNGSSLSVERALDAFVDEVPDEVKALWPDVAAVLSTGHVNPERVAYPPAAHWPENGAEPAEAFWNSYHYFGKSSGAPAKHGAGDDLSRLALPAPPREPNQYLKIIEEG